MKRNHKNKKELKEVQTLKQENTKLRRQVSKLRKVISRIDIEQYEFVKDLVEHQDNQDKEYSSKKEKETLEEKWQCHSCDEGVLRILIVNRIDGTFYFRKCDECNKRTKLKKFHDEVDGVK